ncbi:hypothetical protein MMUR_66000 [Mycolicibacterium murale]|uniref:Cysteine synthase n=1 Tax=Mycolicibacterium murale TaxID=182220 RepID=A0A7I9WXM1_9MYCO|nr:hypothetical protein MMUR_66000 [Mycolicibacterium murale]
MEPSFLPHVVDRMVSVPDAASVAAAHHVSRVLGRRVGASTGTNIWGAFGLLAEMVEQGRSGSVVTLLADSGDRYADTYFSPEWLETMELDTSDPAAKLSEFEILLLGLIALIGGQPESGQRKEAAVDSCTQSSHGRPPSRVVYLLRSVRSPTVHNVCDTPFPSPSRVLRAYRSSVVLFPDRRIFMRLAPRATRAIGCRGFTGCGAAW